MEKEEPLYYKSWKGRVAKAIAIDGVYTWKEIRDTTGLSPKSFQRVLAEMISSKALEKKTDKSYRLSYDLYKQYKKYFEENIPVQKKKVSIPENDQDALMAWIGGWKDLNKPSISLNAGHFYLQGSLLNEFTLKMIEKAKHELIIVNPYVKQCDLSDKLMNNTANVDLITRDAMNERYNTEGLLEYHKVLLKSNVNLYYNERVHAKMLVIDRRVAIVSSLNFYDASSAGKTWESGMVTVSEQVIEEITDSILKLRDENKETKLQ